jgi:MFS family permease
MRSTIQSTAVRRLVALSITARLPEAMLGIGLIVHTQRLTGSFAAAGFVAAAYGLAGGLSGPALGRLIDRRGQTLVLAASASVQAALLSAIAIVPGHSPVVMPLLLAIGIGLATPPIGACLRSQLPSLVTDPRALTRAYALETSILELTWVGGPPLVLGLGAMWSTGRACCTRQARPSRGDLNSTTHRAPSARIWPDGRACVGVYGRSEAGFDRP